MTIQGGSYGIGPENGKLTVSTYVGGMGAKMGHDLKIKDPVGFEIQLTLPSA